MTAADFVFERQELVRFGHCDPAGIVFYPRYFEMLNALVEDWISQGLGVDYAQLLGPRRVGLPSVRLVADFKRISRMGDVLRQRVAISRLGRTSLALNISFEGEDGQRVAFEQVLVCTSLETHKPQAFPDDLRAALEQCAAGVQAHDNKQQ
ncbi:4-hydroxybenzoyl-CoA thioesterase [Paucibacter oligotrophus]|uniref:4-hydroxybenzoyl-CoA thioesterase n=1 Tax=Roseateles oligotrophus TaxID=1769250 RepID=A0A840LB20_9BURK|nr:thioesterase family protein [Roseateles oligotrophus]MBB4843842.1 4-hydroxybenzoyl-CoA thioesterase [Roseateles oligotrophus]